MTDATLLADAPVEVKTFLPDQWKEAMDYDEIVITGTDLLSDFAMLCLAKRNQLLQSTTSNRKTHTGQR